MAVFTQKISTDYEAGDKPNPGTFNFEPPNYTMQNGNDSVDTYTDAVRFTGVTIPKGATISSAILSLNSGSGPTASGLNLKLVGIAEDNTANYSTDPTGRAQTTAFVSWHGFTQTAAHTYQNAPDISSIIQEIVNRSGWVSGNALGILIPDDGSPSGVTGMFVGHSNGSPTDESAYITINYSTSGLISKTLQYSIKSTPTAKQKMLRYFVVNENVVKPFNGLKVAKAGHNVLNTDFPDHLNFSSNYGSLKYYASGQISLTVSQPINTQYLQKVLFTHNLTYFPFTIVYAQDNAMVNPQPLGKVQGGTGAYRQFFYYLTTTGLYLVAKGFTGTVAGDSYTVTFYYKIFRNNLNL